MNYLEAKVAADRLNDAYKIAAAPMGAFPRGEMGLTPDAVKASPEWKSAYARERRAFAELRAFNGWFSRTFKKEIQADRRAKYALLLEKSV